MEISVGIPTLVTPKLSKEKEGTRLENMLIGKDFHWQKELSVLLPGRVEVQAASESKAGSDKGYTVINHVPIEDYLACVVGSEMSPKAPIEFLKAHAIISRSWAVGKIAGSHPENNEGKIYDSNHLIGWDDTSSHHGFHVCSDDHCQRYQGIQELAPEVELAIRSTEGLVLKDKNGNVIDARFSKCCGGMTELFATCWQDIEMPGLKSFADPWCDPARISTELSEDFLKGYDLRPSEAYRWETIISKAEIRRHLLVKFGRDLGNITSLSAVKRGPSGRICLLRIAGDMGELVLGKELWIRRLLSSSHLYSSAFDIEDKGEDIKITGRGWGHGVGLCQIGAANMAAHGFSYREILNFYYQGAEIRSL